jgi:hypothetical protein
MASPVATLCALSTYVCVIDGASLQVRIHLRIHQSLNSLLLANVISI